MDSSDVESTILKGHYDDVRIFTERVAEFSTSISSRGKNSVTKYFLIPRNFRKKIDYECPVSCQMNETKDKIIFIYVVDKGTSNESMIDSAQSSRSSENVKNYVKL